MWVLATFILANVGFLFLSQDVAPSQPVITVHRACGESKATPAADSANPCIAVVTREQFENLVQALHPGEALPSAARNNLAKLYAEYLAVEVAADESGMEDTAEYREFMNWMRALAASEYYRRKLQQKLSSPPREEIRCVLSAASGRIRIGEAGPHSDSARRILRSGTPKQQSACSRGCGA